jgi:hypothetical protein
MLHRLLVIACLLAAQTAAAAPSQEALRARADKLEQKLAGQGFTVMIEGPFVIVGDETRARVQQRATFMRWVLRLIEQDFFAKQPDKLIEVWLFRNEKTYRRGAKKFFGDDPDTPYGYYSPSDDALVMNIGPGAGTLSHELVHPYMEANIPDVPTWFNEGLASLYEQPRERDGHMWGTTNWRLPGLQQMIRKKTLPRVTALLSTTSDEFYDASYDAYAYARFLCQYLQDHGELRAFYTKLAADTRDRTGARALEDVLGQDLASFQPVFEKWAMSLRR